MGGIPLVTLHSRYSCYSISGERRGASSSSRQPGTMMASAVSRTLIDARSVRPNPAVVLILPDSPAHTTTSKTLEDATAPNTKEGTDRWNGMTPWKATTATEQRLELSDIVVPIGKRVCTTSLDQSREPRNRQPCDDLSKPRRLDSVYRFPLCKTAAGICDMSLKQPGTVTRVAPSAVDPSTGFLV